MIIENDKKMCLIICSKLLKDINLKIKVLRLWDERK